MLPITDRQGQTLALARFGTIYDAAKWYVTPYSNTKDNFMNIPSLNASHLLNEKYLLFEMNINSFTK